MRALVIGHDHVAGIEHLGDELAARGYELHRLSVVPEERFDDLGICFGGQLLAEALGAEVVPLERWLALPGGSPPGLDLPALRARTREHAPGAARATGPLLDRLLDD